ncbi:hypothetical protein ACFSF0_00435 [Ottowia flava]|uniref:Uncharacterized protein n=1 Tax=Ottowia flava TaxID=2675430 RepID=A0ABW4KLQ6_9BURK|nr:hypothetical protein [Ottowia sp. GY511]
MRAALAQAEEVNATLIAALERVLPLVDHFGDISESNAIRAAIAKATGAPA